jgi:hypothetical protein
MRLLKIMDLHVAPILKMVPHCFRTLHEQAVQSVVAVGQFGDDNDLETHCEYRVRTIGNSAASPVNPAGAAKESGYQSMTIRTSRKIIAVPIGGDEASKRAKPLAAQIAPYLRAFDENKSRSRRGSRKHRQRGGPRLDFAT